MAHNLNIENGSVALMTRGDAWHSLGQVVTDAQTAAETMELSHTDWTVSKRPLYAQGIDADAFNRIAAFGIFRDDNNEFLGTVGNQYTPIQNVYQFDFVDALMEADGQAHYTSAGALGKGERVFVQADLGFDTEVVAGDKSKNYLTFVNSHDGSMSAKAYVSQVRVVCQNTLNLANRLAKDALNVRHTKNAEERISQARELFQGARQTAESIQEKLRTLAARQLTKADRLNAIAKLFFEGKTQEAAEKDTRTNNLLGEILDLYEYNDNNAFPEIRGTPYNLLNAILEHTDHYKNVRKTDAKQGWNEGEIRANNALFGSGAELKTKALEVIYEYTANAPSIGRTVYSIPAMPPPHAPFNGLLDSILTAHA